MWCTLLCEGKNEINVGNDAAELTYSSHHLLDANIEGGSSKMGKEPH